MLVFPANVSALLPDTKIVYRRYASLFFIAGCSSDDNELITLEIIHRYVEQMDKYYGNVCELDIIFSFTKAYYILDELLLAGELQESSKKNVLRCIAQQDSLEDMEVRDVSALWTDPTVLFLFFPQGVLRYEALGADRFFPYSLGRGRSYEDHVNELLYDILFLPSTPARPTATRARDRLLPPGAAANMVALSWYRTLKK